MTRDEGLGLYYTSMVTSGYHAESMNVTSYPTQRVRVSFPCQPPPTKFCISQQIHPKSTSTYPYKPASLTTSFSTTSPSLVTMGINLRKSAATVYNVDAVYRHLQGILNPVDISKLPPEDKECIVCKEPFLSGNEPEFPIRLRCKHLIGAQCFFTWFAPWTSNYHGSCPHWYARHHPNSHNPQNAMLTTLPAAPQYSSNGKPHS